MSASRTEGRLAGRAALVTGGGRGIGRAIVEAFRVEGADVIACGRGGRPADLDAEVAWAQADVADPAAVARLFAAAEATVGAPEILVNNAGVQIEKTVLESTDDDYELLIGANVRGVFNCARAALPAMLEKGRGVVLNIGSISGEVSDPGMALYNGSKGFVHALTRSIAVDHGPTVRCNAVRPGWIMTGMADAAFAAASDPGAAQSDALNRHAARRFGQPEDIARAIVWLASDEAAFVTGQCITVDGGLTAASPLQPHLF